MAFVGWQSMFTFPPSFTLAPLSDATLSGTLFSKPPAFVAGVAQSQALLLVILTLAASTLFTMPTHVYYSVRCDHSR